MIREIVHAVNYSRLQPAVEGSTMDINDTVDVDQGKANFNYSIFLQYLENLMLGVYTGLNLFDMKIVF